MDVSIDQVQSNANETARLYRVMNERLSETEYFAGEYSIADMAIYPWTVSHEAQGQKMEDFPNLKRWYEDVGARPAVQKALKVGEELRRPLEGMDQKTREMLFGKEKKGKNPRGSIVVTECGSVGFCALGAFSAIVMLAMASMMARDCSMVFWIAASRGCRMTGLPFAAG